MPRRAPGRSVQPASSREAELVALLAERERELAESRAQQAATAGVLEVISQSATALAGVLDRIAESAARLTYSEMAAVHPMENGALARMAAVGPWPEGTVLGLNQPTPLTPDSVTGRAALDRRTVHVPDLESPAGDEYPRSRLAGRKYGYRSLLNAPLLHHGQALGVLAVARSEPRPYSPREIALLETFASQAVIAIENARLFSDLEKSNASLEEALEQQTATAEVLAAIARSPTDLQGVLDTIVSSAVRLCGAETSVIQADPGGGARIVALAGPPERLRRVQEVPPATQSAGTVYARVMRDGQTFATDDAAALPSQEFAQSRRHAEQVGTRSMVSVPLLRDGRPTGVLAAHRFEVRPFTERQIKLLESFAHQAVIAIENGRLFSELQERTEQLTRSVERLTALFEVGQAVSGTLDLQRVLDTVVARASELAGADGGAVYEYDRAARAFDLRATHGMTPELVAGIREARVQLGQTAVGRAAAQRAPLQVADMRDEPASAVRDRVIEAGFRALLVVPLLREEEIIGALVVRRREPGAFADDTVALLQTFATQSALAIQNARLFQEIEEQRRQLAEASRHKSEFLANMSHELRTPLNAVIGFTEVLLEKYFGEINEKQEEYLKDVLSSGQHLLSLINDILDLSKVEAGRMELELGTFDLGSVLAAGLVMVRERASRAGVALSLDVAEDVGGIEADERKVKQVLFNLLTNAVKFTPEGGAVGVAARRADGWVEVAVQDTGVGIAPEEQGRVFEEFGQARSASGQSEGTGLGLTLCKRFVELHGGTIRVASRVGHGSTFTVALPMRQPPAPVGPPGQP